jgi:small subunit ribosomal protein S16
MAVRIRLKRRGRKKLAMYDIIVADARSPRDGKFIEKLGLYNPNTDPATIELNTDKAFEWVMDGAQPSDTARSILSYKGVMIKKHLQVGVNKGAITQEEADKKYADWMNTKEAKIDEKVEGIAKIKAAINKSAFEAETKVKEARAEMLLKKQSEMIAAEEAAAKKAEAEAAGDDADAPEGEEAPVAAAETTEAAPVEEAPVAEAKEEAPVKEAKEEAPVAEAKEEAPAKEVKEEAPVAEAPAEEAKAEAKPVAEKKDEEKKEG